MARKKTIRPFLFALCLLSLLVQQFLNRHSGTPEVSAFKSPDLSWTKTADTVAPEKFRAEGSKPADVNNQEGRSEEIRLKVSRVVDGDTFELENGEKVRLIGIDTPESRWNPKLKRDAKGSAAKALEIESLGKKSSAFTKELLRDQKVRLEYDVQHRDKYGRILAYAFLEDGRFVNGEIMKAGMAQTMTIPPNVKYKDLLQNLQQEAKREGRGLWTAN